MLLYKMRIFVVYVVLNSKGFLVNKDKFLPACKMKRKENS